MTEEDVNAWCCELVESSQSCPPFDDCVDAIPRLDSLADLPAGTRVLVRCDTNVVSGSSGCVENDSRLVSVLETLQWGRERGWVQIVHGHIGNNNQQSLRPVAVHLGRLLGCSVDFLADWMDDQSGEVHGSTGEKLSTLAPGKVVMLENARRYPLETCLWRPRPASLAPLVSRLTRYVCTVRERLAVDFVLEDGSVVERIPAGAGQRDVGPRTLELFALRLKQFALQRPKAIIFHNGVLGQFERPEFAAGTRRFLATLKDMYSAGLQVYVGGGEGGTALERLGDPTAPVRSHYREYRA